jgi:hypothetical protein
MPVLQPEAALLMLREYTSLEDGVAVGLLITVDDKSEPAQL